MASESRENAALVALLAALPADETAVEFAAEDGGEAAALPMQLYEQQALTSLTVGGGVNRVPYGALPSALQTLVLYNLDLAETGGLPADLGRCAGLTSVTVDCCGLRGLPDSLSELTMLTQLNLRHNELTEAVLPQLWALPSLTLLDLSRNRIRSLPEQPLPAPQHCLRVNLSHNQIAALPHAVAEACRHGNHSATLLLSLVGNPIHGRANMGVTDLVRYARALGAVSEAPREEAPGEEAPPPAGASMQELWDAREADGDAQFLLVDGRVAHGHRAVLAAGSKYFAAMLVGPLAAEPGAAIPLPEHVDPELFLATLRFVYGLGLPEDEEELSAMALPWLLYASEIRHEPLVDALTDLVVLGLAPANASSVLEFASTAGLPELRLRALLFALSQFDELKRTASFNRLPRELKTELREKHTWYSGTAAERKKQGKKAARDVRPHGRDAKDSQDSKGSSDSKSEGKRKKKKGRYVCLN